jgi:hypothetical protein
MVPGRATISDNTIELKEKHFEIKCNRFPGLIKQYGIGQNEFDPRNDVPGNC